MSRSTGFAVADHAVRFLYDLKVVRAMRQAGSDAVVAYIAVRDASWEAGGRVSFDEAVEVLPVPPADTALVKNTLVDVGLLDGEGRIPETTWADWFGATAQRREAHRERWRRANAVRAATSPLPRGNSAVESTNIPFTAPSVPILSYPSVPSRAGARVDEGLKPLKETIEALGLPAQWGDDIPPDAEVEP